MSVYFSYALVVLSLFLLWNKPFRKISVLLLIFSLCFATIAGIVGIYGLIILIVVFLLSYMMSVRKLIEHKILYLLLFPIVVVFFLSLYIHVIPVFSNVNILYRIQVSTDAIPFSLYLNYDSIVVTYCLLFFSSQTALANSKEILIALKQGFVWGIVSVVILTVCAFAVGFVHWDVKFTQWTLVFLVVNLVFTCISEEVFWRGFVQNNISRYTNGCIAIFIAAGLFALIHIIFAGVYFAILAFIAGILYGSCYLKTKRIEASILCHYMVNVSQFIFVTYPILKTAMYM